ncbi:MAG TPA: TadE/TadG family type IV pilus assembly protein [Acidimicrobiales bacterium]|nr:TadE/TadG family type IV pilus assembly protein [Acidimicrobiales bacterium]
MLTTTIVAAVLMVAVALLVQFALVFHARQVATAAAQDGLRAGQQHGATPNAAATAARRLAAGDTTLDADPPEVTVTGRQMQVVVTGTAPSLVPGIHKSRVRGVAAGPIEAFRAPSQR